MLPVVDKVLILLRDTSWAGVGIILGIAFQVLDVIFQIVKWRHFPHKAIAYTIVSSQFFSHPTYGPVTSIIWRMWNCGTDEILREHFDAPVEFTFGTYAAVLDARVGETEPPRLRPVCVRGQDNVVLHPILLNRRDSITLEFLVANYELLQIHLRIVGRTIDVFNYRRKMFTSAQRLFYSVLVLFFLWLISFVAQVLKPEVALIHSIYILLVILLSSLATVSSFHYLFGMLNYRK